MKNIKTFIKVAACSMGMVLATAGHAEGINAASEMGIVTIVQPISVVTGKNPAEVYKAMQNMSEAIRKMPGLVNDVVLENKNPAIKPAYVHVMRWKDQRSWEAMFANLEFQKAIKNNAGYFVVDAAGIYTPMK
jgi:ATP-dependent protease ClpP protease subunit